MATITKPSYGASNQTVTITLASLANGTSRQSTVIDNTSNLYVDVLVTFKIKTGAAGNTAAGTVELYAIGTTDGGTTYTDGGGATDAAITVNAAPFIGSFPATANATTYTGGPVSVAAAFGGTLPQKFAVVVKNNTPSTFDTTGGNFAVQYQGVQLQNV